MYTRAQDFWANLWVVNDTPRAFSGTVLQWRIEDSAGRAMSSAQVEVDIPPDSAARYASLANPKLVPGQYALTVTLTSATGDTLGRNVLRFEIASPEGE